jgi:hypothetical protein
MYDIDYFYLLIFNFLTNITTTLKNILLQYSELSYSSIYISSVVDHSIEDRHRKELFSEFLEEISEEDQQLLQTVIHDKAPTSQAFEHAWGYVIQATRYGKLRWYDPRTNSLIFFGRKSSEDHTLVVPTFFATPGYLATTLRIVQKLTGTSQTILKNIDPKAINLYLPYGFKPYTDDENWDPEARFDDQTFPQLLVDLKAVTESKGSDYRKLRKYLRRGNKYQIRPYQKLDREAVLNLLALKDCTTASRKYSASHDMYPSSATEKFVIVDNERIVGFTVTSDISAECTAFCAGIFLPGKPELAPWGLHHTMEMKYRQGFKTVNLGGSETQGTMEFKRQLFRPMRELPRTHLIFRADNSEVL